MGKPVGEKKDDQMEDIKDLRKQPKPRDTYKVAYIIHFFLGAGNVLPWNALITAVDYFDYLYPSKHVEKTFSIAYMSSSLLVLLLMMSLRRTEIGFRTRLNMGFSMFAICLMVNPIMDWTRWKKDRPTDRYAATIVSVVLCGLADGLVGGSLIGSAGKLPNQFMQAVFAGTACSGVLVSILRIITKASFSSSPQGLKTSAHFYFIVSTITQMCCIVCCNLLGKLPVMQQHFKFLQDDPSTSTSRLKLQDTVRKVKLPAFGILMIYAITLSIFPGFIAENLKSSFFRDWYPILLIAVYNFSDLVGKSLTAIYVMKGIGKASLACMCRLLFYPLFAGCLHGRKWVRTEVPVVLLTFLLGLTNGYLTSVLMILTPKSVPDLEAEKSAVVMAVFLGFGLLSGSVLGWFWII